MRGNVVKILISKLVIARKGDEIKTCGQDGKPNESSLAVGKKMFTNAIWYNGYNAIRIMNRL